MPHVLSWCSTYQTPPPTGFHFRQFRLDSLSSTVFVVAPKLHATASALLLLIAVPLSLSCPLWQGQGGGRGLAPPLPLCSASAFWTAMASRQWVTTSCPATSTSTCRQDLPPGPGAQVHAWRASSASLSCLELLQCMQCICTVAASDAVLGCCIGSSACMMASRSTTRQWGCPVTE
jgi:hypothetical protein